MTWTRLQRLHGTLQHAKRRCGQDPLSTFQLHDAMLLLRPPVTRPPGSQVDLPHERPTRRQSKRRMARLRAGADRTPAWEMSLLQKQGRYDGDAESTSLRVVWPEDRLMWECFRRQPEIRLIPYRLNSFNPPFAKRFALRQYQLMQQGRTKQQAYDAVALEMAAEKDRALRMAQLASGPGDQTYSAIDAVQEQEEAELAKAMDEYESANA